MRRREFLGLLGAAAWPVAARAQQAKARPRLAVLMGAAETLPDSRKRVAAFRAGLAKLGWSEGANIDITYRWANGDSDAMHSQAEEVVRLAPDVIVANGTGVLRSVRQLTKSIPVVFVLAIDPVGLGYVQSLARPGANITGFTFMDPELMGKWIGLLHESVPAVRRAALPFDPSTSPFYFNFVRELQAKPQPGGIEVVPIRVSSIGDLANAVEALGGARENGLMIGPGPLIQVNIKAIAQFAARQRLPSVSVYEPFVRNGGLMTYGPDTADIFRRSASYVNRILKGANPAELPVQQPSKFEFIINMKTAKALGVSIPQMLLATADEVIE